MYGSYFDENLVQLQNKLNFGLFTVPSVIDIDVPDYSIYFSGPEDPRLFRSPQNETLMIYNILSETDKRIMKIYSFDTLQTYNLTLDKYPTTTIGENTEILVPKTEKNWVPIVTDSKVYFLYSLTPSFQVIECKESVCYHVNSDYSNVLGKIKCASPFFRFQDNFYVSFSYIQIFYKENAANYRPSVTVIEFNPIESHFSYIGTSTFTTKFDFLGYEPYTNEKKLQNLDELDLKYKVKIVIISSIAKYDDKKDIMTVLGFIDDSVPFVSKIKGMKLVISEIIENYYGKYYQIYN